MNMYHIIDVLPVIECDELESGEHRPEEIIEARVSVVRILADAEACVCRRAVSRTRHVSAQKRRLRFVLVDPVISVVRPT